MKHGKIWARLPAIICMAVLVLSFVVIRFPLYPLHKIKQWSLILFIVAILVILVFGVFIGFSYTPILTICGYTLGFVLALAAHSVSYDKGGGALDNLWIIWTIALLCEILTGIGIDLTLVIQKKIAAIRHKVNMPEQKESTD